MALWIRVTEETVTRTHVSPANGRAFQLEELQRMVGGYVEALNLRNGQIMWLNEDGKGLDLPFNPPAHLIATKHAGIAENDYIVGDVVIASLAESGEGEDDDEN